MSYNAITLSNYSIIKCTIQHDNTKVLEEILKNSNNEGRVVSNYGGWQSEDLFNASYENNILEEIKPNSTYTEIYKLLTTHIPDILTADTVKTYFPQVSNYQGKIQHCWANINRSTDYNAPHSHGDAIISGVYYVKVPEEDKGTFVALDNNKKYKITPKENTFLFFSGDLIHYVEPFYNDDYRVSLAFNVF